MSSQCTNDGDYSLTVTFKPADLNISQVLVQNRVSLAQPVPPILVRRRGIAVTKKSASVLMIVNLYSPHATRNAIDLSNYATIQPRRIGPPPRSRRHYLSGPTRLQHARLARPAETFIVQPDVRRYCDRHLAAEHLKWPPAIGQPPVPERSSLQYTMTTLGRLSDAVQVFEQMVVASDARKGDPSIWATWPASS